MLIIIIVMLFSTNMLTWAIICSPRARYSSVLHVTYPTQGLNNKPSHGLTSAMHVVNVKGQNYIKRKQTLLFCYCPCVLSGWMNTGNLSELTCNYLFILLAFSLIFSIRNISYFQLKQTNVINRHECKQ